ncbi:MAG: peptide deformylase [Acidimicrobiia bacterium]
MAVRDVVHVPSSVLGSRCDEVAAVDDSVRALVTDLIETMAASPACVGLAANQIGDNRRVFVVDVTGHPKTRVCHGRFVIINPVVIASDGVAMAREGCMSVPDLTGNVRRAASLTVEGWDGDGAPLRIETDAFEARAIQHELDHLDGKVFIDRVDSFAADVFRRQTYVKPPERGEATRGRGTRIT